MTSPHSFPLRLLDAASLQRRDLLRMGAVVLLLGTNEIALGASILAVRVWPAKDYTRLTIESDGVLNATQTLAYNPPRVVVDIVGLELNADLQEIVGRVAGDDPYIGKVRVAQNRPGVVRMVLDLKQRVEPQVFSLPPVAAYRNRLVLDLYPTKTQDPLAELIASYAEETAAPNASNAEIEDKIAALLAQQNQPQPSSQQDDLASLIESFEQSNRNPPLIKPDKKPHEFATAPKPQAPVAQPPTAAAPTRGGSAGRTQRLIIVALDPGHGGEDPGAIGPNGTREKDIVLMIAKRLQARINASSVNGNPMRAFLTRDADFFVPLKTRVQKAQSVRADLFISIHADAFITPQARGASVFALSQRGGSSAAARWLADKENQADAVGGVNIKADKSVRDILADMSVTAQIRDSMKLGSHVLGAIGSFARLHKPRVEQASFAVLKAAEIPSVLIETAFISNPEEEQRLRDSDYQERLAEGVMQGIKKYFAANPPLARGRQV